MILANGVPVTATVFGLSQKKYFATVRNRCEIQQRASVWAAILLLNWWHSHIRIVCLKHIYFMHKWNECE